MYFLSTIIEISFDTHLPKGGFESSWQGLISARKGDYSMRFALAKRLFRLEYITLLYLLTERGILSSVASKTIFTSSGRIISVP